MLIKYNKPIVIMENRIYNHDDDNDDLVCCTCNIE